MYLPAMPQLERVFATDAARVQWTLAAFFLGFALGQAFYGPVADRYGRKPSLYVGLALYIGASIGCALAPGIGLLTAFRFLEAIGACAGAVVARAVVSDLFTGQEAARLFTALMVVMGVAPIVAPLIGSYLLLWFDWPVIFWVLAAFGVACLLAVWLRLPETHRTESVRSLALGSVVTRYLLLLFDRRYLGYALSGAASMAGMFAYIAGSPFVFITLHHLTPQHYAWLFGANAFGIALASRINHALLRRYSADALLVGASAVQAAAGGAVGGGRDRRRRGAGAGGAALPLRRLRRHRHPQLRGARHGAAPPDCRRRLGAARRAAIRAGDGRGGAGRRLAQRQRAADGRAHPRLRPAWPRAALSHGRPGGAGSERRLTQIEISRPISTTASRGSLK